eukprot:scaffold5808_cov128-Isochrysis_galbana.AAC.19
MRPRSSNAPAAPQSLSADLHRGMPCRAGFERASDQAASPRAGGASRAAPPRAPARSCHGAAPGYALPLWSRPTSPAQWRWRDGLPRHPRAAVESPERAALRWSARAGTRQRCVPATWPGSGARGTTA